MHTFDFRLISLDRIKVLPCSKIEYCSDAVINVVSRISLVTGLYGFHKDDEGNRIYSDHFDHS